MNKIQFYGQIRAVACAVAGLLAHRGIVTQSDTQLVVAIIVGVAMMVWSFVEKKQKGADGTDATELVRKAGMALAICVAMLAAGCATNPNDVAMAQIAGNTASNYYTQANNAEYLRLEGSNVTWTISGCTRVVLSGPIPAKSIYPREEGTLKTVVDGVTDITKTATMGVFGVNAVKAVKAQQPTVVTTEKLVTVPAQ